ncbi:G kinase-anchoring protein 1-like [Mya arenaria]|uniref:G kinase-anchoring protein 1-like n=1 Tax=Mya arenaria TaxID=6604 RepID=UPI0022E01DB2|nr:G kinase-anchoring protein 1-like [Mya arenaria]
MASIKVQQSRFALLKVEDDDSDDNSSKSTQRKGSANQTGGQKKKNKKKKHQQENEQLKHLAFGLPAKGHHGSAVVQNGSKPKRSTEQQWDEWQKVDEEYAHDAFEKDLQQALLLSKLENEQKKQTVSDPSKASSDSQSGAGDGKSNKKKKKKDKPTTTMSLEQFNKNEEQNNDHVGPSSPKVAISAADKQFFQSVTSDVDRILRQEKMQEEYKKQYAAESVITAKYQEQINKMEKEIEFLRATMKKQEEELKQVKKRNKQLCVILAQGEMKDKAEVLMQVHQLTEVKDELTDQVADLTAELEKERSKLHAAKSEIEKLKGGKHK